jgi:hypothetical protein
VYANRGCLHDDRGQIRRAYNGRRWIACRLAFKGWHRGALMQPGRFTELFFLDEATAMAAGHRPCALCRREDYDRFGELWRALHPGDRGADAIDERLHAERLLDGGRGRRLHAAPGLAGLPDGAFVLDGETPCLVLGGALRPWTPAGYGAPAAVPPANTGRAVTVITPPSLLEALRAGWSGVVPLLHPSAF